MALRVNSLFICFVKIGEKKASDNEIKLVYEEKFITSIPTDCLIIIYMAFCIYTYTYNNDNDN